MTVPLKAKKAGLIAACSLVALGSLFIARESLRPEWSWRRTLSEIIYKGNECWQIIPFVADRQFEFIVDLDGFKYHGRSDNYIDLHILYCGAYEKDVLYFMRDVMLARGTDGIFVDVGANTGQHSLFMSQYSKEVHAFEPYPPVLARFRNMISINGIQNIRVHPVGLGNQKSKLPFYEPPSYNLGMGSFSAGFASGNQLVSKRELEIVVGDDEFERLGISKVDLIKIDIEGYEKLALEGLSRTLIAYRPIVNLELTVDPKLDFNFESEHELRHAFPEGYEFLVFDQQQRDLRLGHYYLMRFDFNFDRFAQYNLVVYPSEKANYIPRSNIK